MAVVLMHTALKLFCLTIFDSGEFVIHSQSSQTFQALSEVYFTLIVFSLKNSMNIFIVFTN